MACNSIVRFNRASAPVAPDVHPAAMAAAPLLFVNEVPSADFEAAVAFFIGLSEAAWLLLRCEARYSLLTTLASIPDT